VKVDPEVVKQCIEHYKKAVELMEEIHAKVEEFCEANDIRLITWVESLEPIVEGMESGSRYPMVWLASKKGEGEGEVVVDWDGTIKWRPPTEEGEEE
jgi:predicted RNA methylase